MIELEPQPETSLDYGRVDDELVWFQVSAFPGRWLETWKPPKPGMVPKLINERWVWTEADTNKERLGE